MTVLDFGRIHGERIKNSRAPNQRICDRCGRSVVQDRTRKDGLVLCKDCVTDKWFIQTAGRTVRA